MLSIFVYVVLKKNIFYSFNFKMEKKASVDKLPFKDTSQRLTTRHDSVPKSQKVLMRIVNLTKSIAFQILLH